MRIAAMVVGACVVTGVVWLLLGSRIVLVMDRIFPGRPSPKPLDDFVIDAESFVLSRRFPLPRDGAFGVKITLNKQNWLELSAKGRTFVFGPVKTRWDEKPEPQYLFVPEPGDVISFTRVESRLHWQTPFAFSFLGGFAPKSHRYAYDRLHWRKTYGTSLEITWRDEQSFDAPSGSWSDEYNNRLTSVQIRLAVDSRR